MVGMMQGGLGNLRVSSDPCLTPYTETNSRCVVDLNTEQHELVTANEEKTFRTVGGWEK